MTNYDGAFQMGLSANFAVAVQNEVLCAGEALATHALKRDGEGMSAEEKSSLSHVLNHLSVIRELAEVFDQYLTEKVEVFSEENPGKLEAVSKEISEDPLIATMQDVIGMTQEERVARIKANLGDMLKNLGGAE